MTRPTGEQENDPEQALLSTRVPHSDFPRNEGVRGLNPRALRASPLVLLSRMSEAQGGTAVVDVERTTVL